MSCQDFPDMALYSVRHMGLLPCRYIHQSTVPPSVTRCNKHHQAKDWGTTKEPDMHIPGGMSSGLEFVNTLDLGPFSD